MKHLGEINNRDIARKKGSRSREVKKTNSPRYDFGKFPDLKQNSNVCRMDGILWNWPNEENEGLVFFFFFLFLFLFMQYLPLSWLGRVTRWPFFTLELFDTSIVIKIEGMQETADILWESDLLWLTLSNIIFLFTSFVHLEREKIKQIALLSNSV